MKHAAILLVCALVVLGTTPAGSAQSAWQGPPGPPCQGDADFLAVMAAVQQRGIPYFHEVEVILANRMPGKIQMDPGKFTLTPDQGEPASPLTQEQAVQAVRNPSQQFFGFLLFGVVGLIANAETQKRWAAEVEARILKAGELPPGMPVRGSVYFKPNPKMTRFTLTLDGFAAESGERLATVRLTNCQVPSRGAATAPTPTASPTPNVKAVALSARAATGPVTVSISNAEFTSDVTVLTISIENAADVEVSLFSAIGGATLTDNTGKAYAVRMLRSDLPDRVPARGRIQGRLAFEPLPPTVTSAILTVPEIRIGDDVYEIKADLRF